MSVPVTLFLMQKIHFFVLCCFLAFSKVSASQNKAIVVQNVWNNDLNNYNPKEFLDQLYEVLKAKLQVRDFIATSGALTYSKKEENWDKNIQEQVKSQKAPGENAEYNY